MHMFFLCVDSLARIEKSALSDQTFLEILVQHFEYRNEFRNEAGDFEMISEWPGVHFREDNSVKAVNWSIMPSLFDDSTSGGRMDMQWLPNGLESFEIACLQLEGSVETCLLPRGLVELDISHNRFIGSFQVEQLPQIMKMVNIASNQLSGTLDFTKLSETMETFTASDNSFEGVVDMANIPQSLPILRVNNNRFCGSLDLTVFPKNFMIFEAEHCRFSKWGLTLGRIPETMMYFRIDEGVLTDTKFDVDGRVNILRNGKVVTIQLHL